MHDTADTGTMTLHDAFRHKVSIYQLFQNACIDPRHATCCKLRNARS